MVASKFMDLNIINQLQQWYSQNAMASNIVTFLVIGVVLFALIFSIIDN
jgi:hypothetical protein